MNNSNLVEVYRKIDGGFNKNKCYYTCLYTKKVGSWPNEKYYVPKDKLEYVGKFKESGGESGRRAEYGGPVPTERFMLNGKEKVVSYDYGGKRCFLETKCQKSKKSNSIFRSLASKLKKSKSKKAGRKNSYRRNRSLKKRKSNKK